MSISSPRLDGLWKQKSYPIHQLYLLKESLVNSIYFTKSAFMHYIDIWDKDTHLNESGSAKFPDCFRELDDS